MRTVSGPGVFSIILYSCSIWIIVVQLMCNFLFVVLVIYAEKFSLVRNHCVFCILPEFFMHGQLFSCKNYVCTRFTGENVRK